MENYKTMLPSIGSREAERDGGRSTVTEIAETDGSSDARPRSTTTVVGARGSDKARTTAGGQRLECHSPDGVRNQPSTIVGVTGRKAGTTLLQPPAIPDADIGPAHRRGGSQRLMGNRGEMTGTDTRRNDPMVVLENQHLSHRRPADRPGSVIRPSDIMCNYLNAVRKGGSNGNETL